jgi:hypothetical protein
MRFGDAIRRAILDPGAAIDEVRRCGDEPRPAATNLPRGATKS